MNKVLTLVGKSCASIALWRTPNRNDRRQLPLLAILESAKTVVRASPTTRRALQSLRFSYWVDDTLPVKI